MPHLGYASGSEISKKILAITEVECANYLRFEIEGELGILGDIGRILTSNRIPIQTVKQRKSSNGALKETLIILTRQVSEKSMTRAIEEIESLETVDAPVTRYRLELENQ